MSGDVNGESMLIDLTVEQQRICAVEIKLRRVHAAERLSGLPVHDAVRLMPLLHAVCARAQSAAATAARDAAFGNPQNPSIDDEVAAEAAREHLLSISTGVARSALAETFRSLREPRELRRLLDSVLLGIPTEQWLALSTTTELFGWAQHSEAVLAQEFRRRHVLAEPPASAIGSLPVLLAATSGEYWPDIPPAFSTHPQWHGTPAEVGAVSREGSRLVLRELKDRPLLQRWLARVVELARYACADPAALLGRVSAVALTPGHGRSVVETARGMLLHDLTIAEDRVVRYRVVAPTEWNFHPDGPLREWLEGLPVSSADLALDFARRAAEALDPCVEHRCVVRWGNSAEKRHGAAS